MYLLISVFFFVLQSFISENLHFILVANLVIFGKFVAIFVNCCPLQDANLGVFGNFWLLLFTSRCEFGCFWQFLAIFVHFNMWIWVFLAFFGKNCASGEFNLIANLGVFGQLRICLFMEIWIFWRQSKKINLFEVNFTVYGKLIIFSLQSEVRLFHFDSPKTTYLHLRISLFMGDPSMKSGSILNL